ncbi:DUF4037 domain-containing protein [Microlunatus endophyticus]|uniref:DUF4037 domain-containing protein n=1 Tax=Microlunatus endophyticus TaxID=1716077 RepID=UPI001E2CF725|nr:DUF4037 domain-containing protein [Microlunatus endophyticus]
MTGDQFISGRQLCSDFYTECVRPVLDSGFAAVPNAAALLGRGSEVLGYDDLMSADHNDEARVLIFLADDDHERYASGLGDALAAAVPEKFAGRPTQYRVTTIRGYVAEQLRFDVDAAIRPVDWLTWAESRLIMVTGGAIFHDEVGLTDAIDRFHYYPDDVWYYLMLAGWWRVHPELNLVGRSGFVGDELGSAVIGTRLVHDLMGLCFLLERTYAPYDKWFGTAFSRLECGPELSPILHRVLHARRWQDRESALQEAYERVAALHNRLAITEPVPTSIERMWDRPFGVLWGDFPAALRARITDPEVVTIAEAFPVGGAERPREVLGISRDRLLRMLEPA